jgi:hypothetical protein
MGFTRRATAMPFVRRDEIYADMCLDYKNNRKRDFAFQVAIDASDSIKKGASDVGKTITTGFSFVASCFKQDSKDWDAWSKTVTDSTLKTGGGVAATAFKVAAVGIEVGLITAEIKKAFDEEKKQRAEAKAKSAAEAKIVPAEDVLSATKKLATTTKDVVQTARGLLRFFTKLWFRVVAIFIKIAGLWYTSEAEKNLLKAADIALQLFKARDEGLDIIDDGADASKSVKKIQDKQKKKLYDLSKTVLMVLDAIKPIAVTAVKLIIDFVEDLWIPASKFLVAPFNKFLATFIVEEASTQGAMTFCYAQYNIAYGHPRVEKFIRFFNPGAEIPKEPVNSPPPDDSYGKMLWDAATTMIAAK